MSQNNENQNQLSDQELDGVSGGQLSDDNPIFSLTSSGGAGVRAKISSGRASRDKVESTEMGVAITDSTFESY